MMGTEKWENQRIRDKVWISETGRWAIVWYHNNDGLRWEVIWRRKPGTDVFEHRDPEWEWWKIADPIDPSDDRIPEYVRKVLEEEAPVYDGTA